MDAASNNSVEDIRGIKEKVNFLPTLAKYRVYIIDEVHMLSTGAFNALLKTLEEPPEHVKFILATTEPQKLPATILSRCQRFDFKKISNEDMIKRLKVVCEESKIQITEQALNLICTLSEGAARDALSILERCLQDGETNIGEDKIKSLVGIPEFTYVHNIIKNIIEKNVEKSIKSIEDILDEGKDLENFLWEMIKHTKDILIYKVSKRCDIYNEEEIRQIEELSEKTSKEELINIIYKLSELETKMKISTQKTIIFETEIIKLCIKEDPERLEERIKLLEEKLENGNFAAPERRASVAQNAITTHETPKVNTNIPKRQVEETSKKIKQEDITQTKANNMVPVKLSEGSAIPDWSKAISNIKAQGKVMLYANLINTEAIQVNDMTVVIRFNNGLNAFRKELLQKPENMSALTKEISIICGNPMQIKLEDSSGGKQIKEKVPSIPKSEVHEELDILDDLDIPINIIEE